MSNISENFFAGSGLEEWTELGEIGGFRGAMGVSEFFGVHLVK
jgi:hypothetical protein